MTIDMTQFYQVFFDEADEHLADMESLLLELDVDQPDLEMLNAIFRAAHSIKGGAGTFGFTDMARVTHVLETLLDRLRKQELQPVTEMVDAFLEAGDVLKAQLQAHREGEEYQDERIDRVCTWLERLTHGEQPAGTAPSASPTAAPAHSDQTQTAEPTWKISFDPLASEFKPDVHLDALAESLGELGTLQRYSEATGRPIVWYLSGPGVCLNNIQEIFDFICDLDGVQIAPMDDAEKSASPAADHEAADHEDEAFGFFDEAPGTPQDAEDPGYGFFADSPAAPVSIPPENNGQSPDSGYGFFENAPGAEASQDTESDGYGLFGNSPGMEQVASQAAHDREENAQGYGLFDPSPGYPSSTKSGDDSPSGSTEAPTKGGDSGGAPPNKENAAKSQPPKRGPGGDSSIRVSVEKVDQLINLVGELVITHAMLAESATHLDPVAHEKIFSGLSNLERNSRDLQQSVMSIRMMPISFVFNRFPRVVRDTAANLQKKVTLRLVGEDTELDKGLIERLADPLNHLVRNSIDHGIESPEKRRAAGKSETGEIVLRASHQGGNIVIEVNDDGAGLNREKLLAKATERGVPMSDNPSDKEVFQLIFAAGFSTADKVTDISGRGVGMDVVRRNIEQMNGRIEIDSAPGQGTRITIRLPLTLAILDGMAVRLGDETFILPLTAIRESIQPKREQFKTVSGKGRVLNTSGEYLPLVVLQDIFELGQVGQSLEDSIVVIVDTNEGRMALVVDELMAQQQVVIKSLETNYRKVRGVSGATILGDGRVALILDVDELVQLNQEMQPKRTGTSEQGNLA
ncbi:chemotaxis protein CheW [Ectothiorhodospira variabilis]|uniref:chemotaxis protein CheW n=1 Tax=Ectothiorhodospira variabilis TaxID=505694 RepID=UPI001EFB12E0|nr:chemotaxis protein CheW [Ectothiorhodospira variabilis]MCG5493756.1 chemotaxis protein CheW [Ectothiorhodospira variabilis]MCG5497847.1 chemotaxis protein CheW [Ectothiorhodospira variabilis]MCG5503955.1 chemotaxis protein CheW [Ectothiorhodospira variabilis]MCG5507110.1 chemotaxis protein CheW [Ectothiorhodospira variabilis]